MKNQNESIIYELTPTVTSRHRKKTCVHRPKMSGFSLYTTLVAMMMFHLALVAAKVNALAATKKTYRYFGYGSNVIPSTMKALRQIEVREVTAAILPDYELRFTSAAFVRPVAGSDFAASDKCDEDSNDLGDGGKKLPRSGQVVHGLLYTLTDEEFAKVGQTEGVPFGYRWQSVQVYPYRGDGKQAGMDSLNDPDAVSVRAYTLVEPVSAQGMNRGGGDIPPSTSYLGLIQEGAKLWKFDKKYQDELATIQTATSNNLLFPDGWEGPTLQLAEKATGTKRTYMIDGY